MLLITFSLISVYYLSDISLIALGQHKSNENRHITLSRTFKLLSIVASNSEHLCNIFILIPDK